MGGKMKRETYDVIIIGAGMGGLTCGAWLAHKGMQVLDRKRLTAVYDPAQRTQIAFVDGPTQQQLYISKRYGKNYRNSFGRQQL